jgi:hypothetical protein
MPISSAQVTVTTSPTLLVAGDGVAEGVYLHAKHKIYLGGSDVTSGTGYEMDNGDKLTINNHESPIYAITGTGTGTMQVLVVTK